jgi:membrane protein YqaA with SNARE-associated domain
MTSADTDATPITSNQGVDDAQDSAADVDAGGPASKWAIHRRMYNWVLSLAKSKHSTRALFGLSFAESSFFPIPPDALLIPLCLGERKKSFWFATVTTVGSVLGAFLGYLIGIAFIEVAYNVPGITPEGVAGLKSEFAARGNLYVFIAALTPIPFKLLTITAGAAKMNLLIFTLACVIGRGARFYAVAGLFWWVGPKAKPLIDKYFNWLCLAAVVLLVGGFAILKMMH